MDQVPQGRRHLCLARPARAARTSSRRDGITDFDEIAKGKPTADLKGFNYVNASIQEAMRRFNDAYVSHLNPFTGLRYKDDPAIIAFLLTNENDVTHHFGNACCPTRRCLTTTRST